MKSLWNDGEAATFLNDPLQTRVYTSRLLGRDANLVLHGGGNTSVKTATTDLFGDPLDLIYIKGSGWDLATIEAEGFAPVRLDVLQKLARLSTLSDTDMVREQRSAMTDPNAPSPSIEAILHAIIPFAFVDHTHADAVVTITNTPDGEGRIRALYRDRVIVVPYVMPGFVLAKTVQQLTRGLDWSQFDGMILMNHGVFTWGDTGKASYEQMIRLVTAAEEYLVSKGATGVAESAGDAIDMIELATLRREVSRARGGAVLAVPNTSAEAVGFSRLDTVPQTATRGPLTPDHVIRTKRTPLIHVGAATDDIQRYRQEYEQYFTSLSDGTLTQLDPAPRWAVWPGRGTVSFGRAPAEATAINDITTHTRAAIQMAESLGGWQPLPAKDIFDIEYWELEQAKLRKSGKAPPLTGKVAVVTGSASGIGRACVEVLARAGAVVVGLDIADPPADASGREPGMVSLRCDLTSAAQVNAAVGAAVSAFGGIDIVVSGAGIFPTSAAISAMSDETWDQSMAVNLTAHKSLLRACAPFLALGIDPAVVIVGSKNVPAPGRGAAAYSVAKAGLTQLARIAALELGEHGVRVNVVHPNNVFDTGIWTDEILQDRAAHYGMTVEAYKSNNVLGREVTAKDVAELVAAMVGPAFSKTTGAQVPIDGGNDRVI